MSPPSIPYNLFINNLQLNPLVLGFLGLTRLGGNMEIKEFTGEELNQAAVVGQLTYVRQLRETDSGSELSFSLRVTQEGENQQRKVSEVDCVVDNEKLISKILGIDLGRRLAVIGQINVRRWQRNSVMQSRCFLQVNQLRVFPKTVSK